MFLNIKIVFISLNFYILYLKYYYNVMNNELKFISIEFKCV